jgi:drug/metabolite transporter (DMT)-like permease
MRTVFVISLACALMSLLAILGLSAMTIVPGPGAQSDRARMMLFAGSFMLAWICLAFWVRARRRAAAQPPPPQWLRRLLAGLGVAYLLGGLVLLIG